MRVDALARALEDCAAPPLVILQAGQMNTGAFDPFAEIILVKARGGRVARGRGLRLFGLLRSRSLRRVWRISNWPIAGRWTSTSWRRTMTRGSRSYGTGPRGLPASRAGGLILRRYGVSGAGGLDAELSRRGRGVASERHRRTGGRARHRDGGRDRRLRQWRRNGSRGASLARLKRKALTRRRWFAGVRMQRPWRYWRRCRRGQRLIRSHGECRGENSHFDHCLQDWAAARRSTCDDEITAAWQRVQAALAGGCQVSDVLKLRLARRRQRLSRRAGWI